MQLGLGFIHSLGFSDNGNLLDLLVQLATQAASPNIASEQNLQSGGQGHGQNRPEQPTNEQAPDKDRHDNGHGMQPDGVADDARRVKHPFEILDNDKNNCHPKWMPPIAKLKRRDEDGRHPAKDDADVWNHRKDDDEHADERREVKSEKR